jgi:hypothetical protein
MENDAAIKNSTNNSNELGDRGRKERVRQRKILKF